MSDKRYEANIIRTTAVEPANNLESTSAPGVWSLDEVMELQKKNKWPTVGNVTTDITDVFSTFLYEGNGTAQNINNGINIGDNIAGSVDFDGTGDSLESSSHSFAYGTGDFTVEFWMYPDSVSGTINIFDNRSGGSTGFLIGINNDTKIRFYWDSADRIVDSATVSTGQWYHIAVARSSGTTKMFKNGTQIGSDYSDSNNYTSSVLEIGQRSVSDGLEFDGKLSNVRVVLGTAVYTSNFTAPTGPLTAISGTELLICTDNNLLDEGPNKISFTVKGDPQSSSSSPFTGNTGEGGLVWTKQRSDSRDHQLYDTARGADKALESSDTIAEHTGGAGVIAFNSNGFSLGTGSRANANNHEFVAWTFRKAPKFFDVVTYSGTGSTQNISHNLGSVPGMILVKKTNGSVSWNVFHRSLGATKVIFLNTTDQALTQTSRWNDTEPTSTQFTVGTAGGTNDNGDTYVAYLFAHNNNDGGFGPNQDQDIIKCGSFTSDGTDTITLGFEPQWLMVKQTDGSAGWYMWDTMRGWQVGDVGNNNDPYVYANSSAAEAEFTVDVGFPTATGFETKNFGSGDYIYTAIRRGPLAEPESASDVFAISTSGQGGDSKAPAYRSTFPVDMYFEKKIDGTGDWFISSRLTENLYMKTNSTAAEVADSNLDYDFMNGVYNTTGSANAYYGWMWKRAPGYFDVVTYVGAGAAQTVNHNLGVVPEMMWVKSRSTADDWAVYHSALGNTDNLFLNGNNATASRIYWNNTTPTATQFSLGDSSKVSNSGTTYIAYLFATVAGVSKVGSYTGDATDGRQIDCGFTSGAKFVLIKRADSTGNWMVFDTKRGIVAGNDPFLKLNSNGAETSTDDKLDPYDAGFIVNHSGASINNSGATFIFYAIAA